MPNRVRVYRNLNNGMLSIQAIDSGLILAHCQALSLREAVFKVNENGRQRVIQTRRKAVHAFVEGHLEHVEDVVYFKGRTLPALLSAIPEADNLSTRTVHYNPYKWATFVDDHSKAITQAKQIRIMACGLMKATAD